MGDAGAPVPVIHMTDLYHPHMDPDDHWDAALVFALTAAGRYDLRLVALDPPPYGKWIEWEPARGFGDPAIQAVHQLGAIAGCEPAAAVGSPEALLRALAASPAPAAIHVVGSCRDAAKAAALDPALFRTKCRAVYLNAGLGTNDASLYLAEHNVSLDPAAYAAMFELPCPVYWLPCAETKHWGTSARGSFYAFRQGDVLSALSPRLQNYFLYALTRSSDAAWLAYLDRPVDRDALAAASAQERGMYCTAGILHAAGYAVTGDGRLVEAGERIDEHVYEFAPVSVVCDEKGRTRWTPAPEDSAIRMLRVRDPHRYPSAMASAMRAVLTIL
ncbi:hypothetical protein [Paenibacillus sp.]|uniref:hypothetical protein n=1 Tax=Paenibacillus sp. TaxID=58172 RepID=UPI002D3EF813|nr:hypothetical protein [Paenibacillus sp.]HZG54901.1 hypothetical protein [Paenibacillus sp.]